MRRFPRCAAAGTLLVAAGLMTLAMRPGQARLLRADKPAAETAERGGQGIPAANRPAAVCSGALPIPFTLGAACFGLYQMEEMTRYATAVRVTSLPDRAAFWRAPRLASRFARLRRSKADRHERTLPPVPVPVPVPVP